MNKRRDIVTLATAVAARDEDESDEVLPETCTFRSRNLLSKELDVNVTQNRYGGDRVEERVIRSVGFCARLRPILEARGVEEDDVDVSSNICCSCECSIDNPSKLAQKWKAFSMKACVCWMLASIFM